MPLTMALIVKLLFWTAALLVFVRLTMRQSRELEVATRRWSAALLLGALTGSKLVFVLGHPDRIGTSADEIDQILWWVSGNSAIGALLGGYLALCLSEGVDRAERLAAELAIPVASVLLILSLGSFFWALRGSGYGSPTNLPIGVNFGDGAPRHPVMLYEAAFLGVGIWFGGHRRAFGNRRAMTGPLFMFGYCLFTLASGFLKPPFGVPLLLEVIEPAGYLYAGVLTADQCVSALAIVLLIRRLTRLPASDGKFDSAA
jgi:prolipoprotein diacylglyceryltransferase